MLQLRLYFPEPPKCIRGITDQYHLPLPAVFFPFIAPARHIRMPHLPPVDKKNRHQLALFD